MRRRISPDSFTLCLLFSFSDFSAASFCCCDCCNWAVGLAGGTGELLLFAVLLLELVEILLSELMLYLCFGCFGEEGVEEANVEIDKSTETVDSRRIGESFSGISVSSVVASEVRNSPELMALGSLLAKDS